MLTVSSSCIIALFDNDFSTKSKYHTRPGNLFEHISLMLGVVG